MEHIPIPELSDEPLVSVVVPSFNQGRFIAETIDSILSQSYRPLEVLVIDGGSSDNTLHVLKSFSSTPELRWWSEPDSGVVEAVNKGFARARGEIGAIQSSDDYYLPGAVEAAVRALRSTSRPGLVYGDKIQADEEGRELSRPIAKPFSLENFLSLETWITQSSAFFRTQIFKELGGWDPRFFNADTELWLRMMFRTEVLKVDSILSTRRMHRGQRAEQKSEIVDCYWRMIETSSDIKHLEPRLRRAAECGKYRVAAGYNPTGSEWMKTYYNWRAVLVYPWIVRHLYIPSTLIPGYFLLRKALKPLARFLTKQLS